MMIPFFIQLIRSMMMDELFLTPFTSIRHGRCYSELPDGDDDMMVG
jgi:hypothetical protein